MAGGCGGCPPTKPKRERVARISNPATSGAQNAGEPSANGGGQWGGARGLAPWQESKSNSPKQWASQIGYLNLAALGNVRALGRHLVTHNPQPAHFSASRTAFLSTTLIAP